MNIHVRREQDPMDGAQLFEITIDGNVEFLVYDGDPEDSNLSRNFNACFNVVEMLKKVYAAGQNKEAVILTSDGDERYERST